MNEAEKKERQEKLDKISEVVKRRNTDRIAQLEEIADNAEAEQGEAVQEPEVQEPEPIQEEPTEEQRYARALQEEGAQTTSEEDSDQKTVNGEPYYRQIINGQERWQSLKEIRQTAQKVSSADEYLRTASEGARKAAELALSPPDETSSLDKDEVRKLLAAAVLGDEEATDKLASAIEGLSRAQRDVLPAIDQRLSFRTEQSRLEEKSSDLLSDPNMGLLFRAKLNQLRETAPTTSLREAYTSIDAELRSAFPGFKGSRLQEKIERKRTLPIPPNAATRAGTAVEEEEPEDVSRDIAEMAKKRPGATLYVHGPQRRS